MSNSNGTPPSIPVLSGIQNAVGLGSSEQGAPQVTPPNQANFNVPNQTQIQQATETLQNAQIATDPTQLNQITGQEQQLASQDMSELQNGAGPNQSAANMGAQTGLQNNAAQANASQQNSLAGAANPLAAARQAGQQQASQNAQTVAQGVRGRANEENAIRQNAQNALSSASQGTLGGASQRLQAQIAQQNIVQKAIADQTQLSMMQLQGSMNYAQLSQSYQLQQHQDYINAQIKSIQNMQTMMGAILQAAGSAASIGMSSAGTSGLTASDVNNASQMATQGYIGPRATASDYAGLNSMFSQGSAIQGGSDSGVDGGGSIP